MDFLFRVLLHPFEPLVATFYVLTPYYFWAVATYLCNTFSPSFRLLRVSSLIISIGFHSYSSGTLPGDATVLAVPIIGLLAV